MNSTNTKKYHWTKVSMAWVINRKIFILGVNYSFKWSEDLVDLNPALTRKHAGGFLLSDLHAHHLFVYFHSK